MTLQLARFHDVEFGYPLKFLTAYYREQNLTRGVFRNIHDSIMRIFVHFNINLHFQDHLLQELNDQTQCDHLDENLMKIS